MKWGTVGRWALANQSSCGVRRPGVNPASVSNQTGFKAGFAFWAVICWLPHDESRPQKMTKVPPLPAPGS